MIPHSRPTISNAETEAALQVLRSGNIAQGAMVQRFEEEMAGYHGMRGGVALSSGTAALHLSLLALDIGKGDEVVIPSYVCTALLQATQYVGASPVLADIDPQTFNLDSNSVREAITPRTKAVIVPHLFGLSADLDPILELGVPVIEDCAQSLGSTYRGEKAGRFGVLSVFSFFATKMICTGEGGMVLSDREDLLAKVRDLRSYDEKEGAALRFNYKMTDLEGALGISQLESLPRFINRREQIARAYSEAFRDLPLALPFVPSDRTHVYYRYVVRVPDQAANPENAPVENWTEKMEGEGVVCRRPIFRPIHHFLAQGNFPRSDGSWRTALSLPVYPSLKENDVNTVIEAVLKFMQ